MSPTPVILIFDSGLGGLTVFSEITRLLPRGRLIYAADDAAFPYGDFEESALIARVLAVMERLIARCRPDAVVIACNTASTLALPHLRAGFSVPFVGTVPAIKPAASQTRSGLISVLATPGTVARDYTRDLIRSYAAHLKVTLVGSSVLAPLAESFIHGNAIEDAAVLRELAPAFVTSGQGRTDCVVLACTHFPLLLGHFERLAPWPVAWIDPAPAIARRTAGILSAHSFPSEAAPPAYAIFTGALSPKPGLAGALRERGIDKVVFEPMPLSGLLRRGQAHSRAGAAPAE